MGMDLAFGIYICNFTLRARKRYRHFIRLRLLKNICLVAPLALPNALYQRIQLCYAGVRQAWPMNVVKSFFFKVTVFQMVLHESRQQRIKVF